MLVFGDTPVLPNTDTWNSTGVTIFHRVNVKKNVTPVYLRLTR